MYPKDDQFREHTITKADADSVTMDDGWSMFLPDDCPVKPVQGMKIRLYGKGFGQRVRGMFIDGQKVYYRTAAEDDEHWEISLYGKDAADWLSRWDADKGCWTIEMGGLGPGYEQCIHIVCAEVLRFMLAQNYMADLWKEDDVWKGVCDEIDAAVGKLPVIKALGLSGAQWGAGLNIAARLYRDGPRKVMKDEQVKDRHIQVSRTFPQAVAA